MDDGKPEDIRPKNEDLFNRIAKLIDKKLEEHPSAKLLYSRKEAAELLSISLATLQILIARGEIRTRRFGTRRLIPHEELLRVAKKDIPEIWPEKGPHGTRRRIA